MEVNELVPRSYDRVKIILAVDGTEIFYYCPDYDTQICLGALRYRGSDDKLKIVKAADGTEIYYYVNDDGTTICLGIKQDFENTRAYLLKMIDELNAYLNK